MALWPWAALRGAGFPTQDALRLAAPTAASAADTWLASGVETPGDALRTAFDSDLLSISAALRSLAGQSHLSEALLWQNRHAYKTGVEPLAALPATARNSKARQRERLVASYVQRYSTKNDTIGFFGPVGWARLTPSNEGLRWTPGQRLVSRRAVYFETWCLDALSAALARDASLRHWAPPRLLPYFRLEGHVLHGPMPTPVELSPEQALLLSRCDGSASAVSIARELTAGDSPAFASQDEIFTALEQAVGFGVLVWGWEVPLVIRPEVVLRGALMAIEDADARARALAPLERLERARAAVEAAAGTPAALDAAVAELEAVFQEVTGAPPTRAAGQTYASRTLIYEDCARDGALTLGAPVIGRLGAVLELVLTGARWLVGEVTRGTRAGLDALFDRLSEGGAPVSLTALQLAFVQGLKDPASEAELMPVAKAVAEHRRRWRELFALEPEVRRQTRTVDSLRPHVLEVFGEPGPAWRSRWHASPDVMIDAASEEGVRAGDYQLVLGELHLCNSISSLFVEQHPAPEELFALAERCATGADVVPVFPKSEWSQRTLPCLFPRDSFYYLSGQEPPPQPGARALRVGDMVVERRDGTLEVLDRVSGRRFGLMEFMAVFLEQRCASIFDLALADDYSPRVTVDGVVVARERWSAPASELGFAGLTDPMAQWLGARRWQQGLGIPRFAFFKVATERKPCFVDFDSPLLVEMMAKLVRRTAEESPASRVQFSEMLPDPEHLWLTDAAQRRYTSELRLVCEMS
ncbi:lantibiotic dehydratase [Myxococcus sp. AB036A]|uniref:lantibiotic dehydratase n=1 Tax=Myxococcus sp. AB036A TaxID=2562793 RepID=UPI0011471B56|nr:lantibiotic dehydratase [Myxococcus sp. AB036A]